MTDEEKTREQIEEIVNNVDEPVALQENPIEEVKEEIKKEEAKPKAKPRASRAKPKVKIVKESVVEVVEEKPEPVVEEKPKKIDKLKTIVQCPDCGLSMTQHTLLYIHKRRGFCKAVAKSEEPEQTPEPIVQQPKPKPITEDTVNDYIKQNPDIVTNYLRNERILKAQKKQSHARILLNNAF